MFNGMGRHIIFTGDTFNDHHNLGVHGFRDVYVHDTAFAVLIEHSEESSPDHGVSSKNIQQ